MKILFDDQMFTIQQYGGITRYFYEMAHRLADRPDINVRMIAPLYVNRYIEDLPFLTGRRIPFFRGASHLCVRVNARLGTRKVAEFAPDIIHETYYAARVPPIPGAKRILTVFDMIHERFSSSVKKPDALMCAKKAAVERSNHIICISENTKRDLVNMLQVNPEKVSVIYLASSLCPDRGRASSIRAPYILYVGPRGRYKNFDRLLQAYAASSRLLKDVKLVCFGGGRRTRSEYARQNQLNIPAENVVRVSGNDTVLAGLYQHASVFVYPSLYEGFGIPPLEAMRCGCPVICSNTSSLPEVVGDAACLIDPYEVGGITHALEHVLYSTGYAMSLVERGKERAMHFSWDACVAQTLDVYRQAGLGRRDYL